MKRGLLAISCILFSTFLLLGQVQNIQNAPVSPTVHPHPDAIDPNEISDIGKTSALKEASSLLRTSNVGTVVGTTFYDLQTNAAEPRRIMLGPNDSIVTTWTGSFAANISAPDRGTFVNIYDGNSWNTPPPPGTSNDTPRLEGSIRTGWPDNIITSTGRQVSISHNPASGVYRLVQMTRPGIKEGSWQQTWPGNLPSNDTIQGIWPRVTVGGPNNKTVHLINADYQSSGDEPAHTFYSRSTDEGMTWDTMERFLPRMTDTSDYTQVGGDVYSIDAQDSTVAIVAADGYLNPLAVWISRDNGQTFTRKEIIPHPIENMSLNKISDKNGDGQADTLKLTDDRHHVLIDQNGTVHVWSGVMRYFDDDPTDEQFSYFPGTNGLYYWNENMGEDSVQEITGALDLNDNGVLDITNIAAYFSSLSSMPSAAIDTSSGTIFLTYSAIVENTGHDQTNPPGQDYRDIYCMYSPDQGKSWSKPVNLTKDAKDSIESIHNSVARIANGKLHLQWMSDDEPGEAVTGAQISSEDGNFHANFIRYKGFNYNEIDPDTGAQLFIEHDCGTKPYQFVFRDTSASALSWKWKLGDGTTANSQVVKHTYSKDSTYPIQLVVEDLYGTDTIMDTVTVIDKTFAKASNDTSVCPNDSIQISAQGGNSFSWSPATSVSCDTCQNTFAKPAAKTTYVVTVDSSGCADNDSVVVGIHSLLNSQITADPSSICRGDSTTISANPKASSYKWTPDLNIACNTCQSTSAYPNSTRTYDLTMTDSNECVTEDAVTIDVFDGAPAIDSFNVDMIDNTALINFGASNEDKVVWDYGDGTTNNETDPVFQYEYADDGNYTITLKVINPCDTTVETTDVVAGVNEPGDKSASPQFSVYPNPTQHTFYLEMDQLTIQEDITVEVHNKLGQKVYNKLYEVHKSNKRLKIDLDQPEGIYFISVKTQDGIATRKITLGR